VLAAVAQDEAKNSVYNIALGESTTLNQLHEALSQHFSLSTTRPIHGPLRPGDVRHSRAAIDKAANLLGYEPTHRFREGLAVILNSLAGQRQV
jgi:UDP-N-acetylglucosamine 4-epimerase